MSDVMNDLVGGMIGILNTALASQQARAVAEYPSVERRVPAKSSVVAVGLQDIATMPSSFTDFSGLDEDGNSIYGRTLEATVSMAICCAPGGTSAKCLRLFGLIASGLLLEQQQYEVLRVWCGKVAFDKDLGMLVLPCFAKTRLSVCAQRSETALSDFRIRKVSL